MVLSCNSDIPSQSNIHISPKHVCGGYLFTPPSYVLQVLQ